MHHVLDWADQEEKDWAPLQNLLLWFVALSLAFWRAGLEAHYAFLVGCTAPLFAVFVTRENLRECGQLIASLFAKPAPAPDDQEVFPLKVRHVFAGLALTTSFVAALFGSFILADDAGQGSVYPLLGGAFALTCIGTGMYALHGRVQDVLERAATETDEAPEASPAFE